MTGLLGPNGRPISSKDFKNKKAKPPAIGERYGQWAGEDTRIMQLPGGGAIAFDLRTLTLTDYRQMKDHYQINSSLSVLTFMMHQIDWHIECEDKKQGLAIEENLRAVWSRLVRAKSQALWAGYSPNVLQWENDVDGRRIVLDKIKDLIPEDCEVKWDEVSGKAETPNSVPPKFKVYGGIRQFGAPQPIPVANSYWYPLLMENGNYYGRQILKSAFQPWFFSVLLHLFANRYYERFGEPTPVGRAPFEDEIDVDGKSIKGNVLMGQILQSFRNRSTVVLPNEKTNFGEETNLDYDYQIEYLESQMRGADFERYMTRLDEEMSLAMFTPILMMRTADVGSYNLGTQHTQVYKWMLNAISGDWAHYIDKYIIAPMNYFNSPRGERAAPARIKFVQMGKIQHELLQAIVTEMLRKGSVKPDVREIGELAGLTLEEVRVLTSPTDPDEDPPAPEEDDQKRDGSATTTSDLIVARVDKQVTKAFREGTFGPTFNARMGYRRKFEDALRSEGFDNAEHRAGDFFARLDAWLENFTNLGADKFDGPEHFMRMFKNAVTGELHRITR